jgi:hypothetical protein
LRRPVAVSIRIGLAAVGLLIAPAFVWGQSLPPLPHCGACGGRIAVGVQFTTDHPSSSNTESPAVPSPFLWFGVSDGIGPTFGLNWLSVDVNRVPVPGVTVNAAVRVRPVMGGVSYTKILGGTALGASAVGGWSFNSLHQIGVTSASGAAMSYDVQMNDSFVAKGEVSALQTIAARVKVKASLGYLWVARESDIHVQAAGVDQHVPIPLSNLRVQVGVMYVLF